MRRSWLLTSVVLFCLASPALAKDPIRSFAACSVIKVSDGDTIIADCSGTKIKARLYGIDAPETTKINRKTGRVSKQGQPFGEEAEQALEGKIGGRTVKVDVMDVDRYKRLVSMITLDSRDINLEMVSEGWAWAYRQYLHRPYASEYIGAEEQARKHKLGLWKQVNPQPAWEFRKLQKKSKRDVDEW